MSPDGRTLRVGRIGLVEVLARGQFVTYVGEPERAYAARSGKWWRTGDVGLKSRWGCLHLLDRTADVIGSVESTLALEDDLLDRLPILTEVVILSSGADRPVPVISTKDDQPVDGREWAAATTNLPPLAAPVHCRWSEIPRTSTWKVRRTALAQALEAGQLARLP